MLLTTAITITLLLFSVISVVHPKFEVKQPSSQARFNKVLTYLCCLLDFFFLNYCNIIVSTFN